MSAPRSRVRAFFAPSDDPYAGGDLATAGRLGAVLWVIGSAMTWALLPLSEPTAVIGAWGWPLAAVTTVIGLVVARQMRRVALGWDQLLITSYLAVAQVTMLEWLAGGEGSPFSELFLLVALYAGALHPPRRLLGVLLFIAAASVAPLLYDTASPDAIGRTALSVVLLGAIAMLAAGLMRTVRAQRLSLRDRGDEAERLARVDELTGLPNRRAFVEALDTEIARARRFGSELSLVLADLDRFKEVNDTHGHQAGDACLRDAATALQSVLRQYDACFRWGGDEFALLLPSTSVGDAEAVGLRAAEVVAGHATPDGEPLSVTCSAASLRDGMEASDLLEAADAGLLERKRAAHAAAAAL